MNPGAEVELAKQLRNDELTIGEVFGFLSGLYFRVATAGRRGARPPRLEKIPR